MSDILDQVISSVDQVEAANQSTSGTDPIIWVKDTAAYSGSMLLNQKQYQTLSQMQNRVLGWGGSRSPQYDQYVNKLIAGGFMSDTYRDQIVTAKNALAYAVEVYQGYSSSGGKLSFDDWFDWYSFTAQKQAEDLAGGAGGGVYTGPVTTTTTTITDEVTAEALLDRFSRDLLGRSLTQKETNRYLRQFREAEAGAPQVTTTSGSGASRTSVTETAASKEELLRQIVSKNPDFEKYQIDTTIMDLLLEDIKAGTEVIRG